MGEASPSPSDSAPQHEFSILNVSTCPRPLSEPSFSLAELDVARASSRLKPIVSRTPLQLNAALSRRFGAQVYLKREDLQVVRSYKCVRARG
jgi:hypothetical protein